VTWKPIIAELLTERATHEQLLPPWLRLRDDGQLMWPCDQRRVGSFWSIRSSRSGLTFWWRRTGFVLTDQRIIYQRGLPNTIERSLPLVAPGSRTLLARAHRQRPSESFAANGAAEAADRRSAPPAWEQPGRGAPANSSAPAYLRRVAAARRWAAFPAGHRPGDAERSCSLTPLYRNALDLAMSELWMRTYCEVPTPAALKRNSASWYPHL
jgi:hypothetical protein